MRSKMDALEDVKIPTQEYKDIESDIAKAERELQRLIEKQAQMKREGKDSGAAWDILNQKIQASKDYIELAREDMQKLVDAGKAFTLGTETEKYAEMPAQVQQLNKQIQSDTERQAELQNQIAEREEYLADVKTNSTVTDQNIIDLLERRKQLIQEIADMEQVDVGFGHAEYEDAIVELSEIEEEIKDYKDSLSEVPEKFSFMRAAAQKAFDAIRSGLSTTGNIGKKAFSGILGMSKKAFSAITGGSKQANASVSTGLKTILKYTLGIRSLYVLFNKLRSAAKEGLSNLAQYSAPVNESISMLMSSLTQLKNSLATAFSPIITTVAPILTSFISMLSQAATYVGMFIATLTGAKTFTKATAVQEDYAKSLNGTASAAKKAAGALAKFDDLDVLQKQDASVGGAGGVSVGDMFEEVEIPNRFEGIVEWFKQMWDDSDFKELGEYIANGLKSALDGISWSNIKESARNIAKSIATLINGFIQTEGLGYSIGNTLAQGINTGLEFLNSFVHKLDWKAAGNFIAEQLNGFFDGIEWELIYDTFVTGFHGLAESINGFISTFKWDNVSESISWIVRTAADSLTEFFTTTEFKELGTRIGEQFEKLLKDDKMWYSVGKAIGSGLQAAFDFVKGFLSGIHFKDVVEAIKNTLAGFFEGFDDEGELAMIILGIISTKLALKATASMFASTATSIGEVIGSSLTAYALPAILAAVAGWGIVEAIKSIIEGETAIDSIVSGEFKERIIEDYDQIAHASADSVLSIVESNNELVESFDNASEEMNEFEKSTENSTNNIKKPWDNVKSNLVNIISSMTSEMDTSFSNTYASIIENTKSFITDLKNQLKNMPTISAGSVLGGAATTFSRSNFSAPTVSTLNDIPHLATGSVIRGGNPFMAILGDQPAGKMNVEAPADLIKEMARQGMREELAGMNFGNIGSGQTKVVLNINGVDVGEAILDDLFSVMERRGYDVDILGVT